MSMLRSSLTGIDSLVREQQESLYDIPCGNHRGILCVLGVFYLCVWCVT